MYNLDDIETRIADIRKVLDVENIISIHPDKIYIARYYKLNKIPYSVFHTRTDLIYMGISRDGVYIDSDLLEAARTVQGYIQAGNAKTVLELATGRGANSSYLARQFPNIKFSGVDLSPGQLDYAYKKARRLTNYFPQQGDYHDLSMYPDGSFDIVFEVEALCYSLEKEKVLLEVSRVLKRGGLFILFDGYRGREAQTKHEDLSMQLVEKGMALEVFEKYEAFKIKALGNNFDLVKEEDLSTFVLPTMERFEKLANKFFKHPLLAKLLKKILPPEIINNSAAGYLMPTTVRAGLFVYMLTVLKKK